MREIEGTHTHTHTDYIWRENGDKFQDMNFPMLKLIQLISNYSVRTSKETTLHRYKDKQDITTVYGNNRSLIALRTTRNP